MAVMQQIQAEVDRYPLVLFMKGTPQYPMCGFSSRAVRTGVDGGRRSHPAHRQRAGRAEIRANLPRFSNLPTFPQLFINGELIGGCDIVLELFEAGELKRIVEEATQG